MTDRKGKCELCEPIRQAALEGAEVATVIASNPAYASGRWVSIDDEGATWIVCVACPTATAAAWPIFGADRRQLVFRLRKLGDFAAAGDGPAAARQLTWLRSQGRPHGLVAPDATDSGLEAWARAAERFMVKGTDQSPEDAYSGRTEVMGSPPRR